MSKGLDTLAKLVNLLDNEGATEHERNLAREQAERLSAQLNVSLAVARMHNIEKEREVPVANKPIKVNTPGSRPLHRAAMIDLFLEIANAHDVRCTIAYDNSYAFGFGFPSDIEIVETLFGILSYQMVNECDRAIARGEQKEVIDVVKRKFGVDARVYRRNFYEGFSKRVGGRLDQARKEAIRSSEEAGESGTEIALRNKAKEVNDFYAEETKHMSLRGSYRGVDNSNSRVSDATKAGAAAGARANLGLSNRDMGSAERIPLG